MHPVLSISSYNLWLFRILRTYKSDVNSRGNNNDTKCYVASMYVLKVMPYHTFYFSLHTIHKACHKYEMKPLEISGQYTYLKSLFRRSCSVSILTRYDHFSQVEKLYLGFRRLLTHWGILQAFNLEPSI